jgi:hypothetical protein
MSMIRGAKGVVAQQRHQQVQVVGQHADGVHDERA